MRFRRLEARGARRGGGRIELSLELPTSPRGLQNRLCPRESCSPRLFQMGRVQVQDSPVSDGAGQPSHSEPRGEGTTCPYCGERRSDDYDFVDPVDLRAAEEWFHWAASEDVADAFADIFKGVGRRQPRGGLISFSVDTSRRRRPEPRQWREDLLRVLSCSRCHREYGVYAIGLFCPDCGAPSLKVHFERERELILHQVELARSAESAELGFRLLGNAHEDVVTALETYLKTVYRYLLSLGEPSPENRRLGSTSSIRNTFQNVERGRQRFEGMGCDPFSSLTEEDIAFLRLSIEKRHLIGHNLGLMDERYQEVAGDAQPGRNVRILAEEVLRFSQVAAEVIATLEAHLSDPASLT